MDTQLPEKITANAVWISDVHLGYKDCKATYLLDFLNRLECNTLYLVGDIIDMWSLSKNFYWPEQHNKVIRKLMKMAKKQCRVIYIPGNHDVNFRDFVGEKFGEIEVHQSYVHKTSDQRQMLIIHGDELDSVIRFSRITRFVGDSAYDFLLFLNRWTNYIRQKFGYGYWSLAAYLKKRVSKAKNAIDLFEDAAIELARKKGYDGVICGHIHHANIREDAGILYCNDGDWIESCSFMIEKHDGSLEIMHWTDQIKKAQVIELNTKKLA
ncbi:UDP-2,3-diacylglucosamine diphosphatase [Catenovulum sp. SM1970]|uniref:UDP-2,3-diacylglucosamine diphosphatase n=1 Tax=Marinifaba aquimaris TaxID=2741323 RepID=UPI001572063B|nr:UDP-2,3-diacylglucosamine diphosphatase [Marinifaba aquimaris]NTS77314.1 UDP-2,3-diacylglucosamine diphosphatase [Marinifaba aquimaris]